MFQYALDAWQNESAGEQSLQTLSKLGYSDTAQVQRWLELMRRAPAYARLNNSERSSKADARSDQPPYPFSTLTDQLIGASD